MAWTPLLLAIMLACAVDAPHPDALRDGLVVAGYAGDELGRALERFTSQLPQNL